MKDLKELVQELGIEWVNELGALMMVRALGNRKYLVIRTYGIEQLTVALDPSRTKFEIICASPRRIMSLRQVKYRLEKRRSK